MDFPRVSNRFWTFRGKAHDDHFAEQDAGDECRLGFAASASLSFPLDYISSMKTRINIIWASSCLLLLGYAIHLTYHVGQLEARIQRLEASQEALGCYTYDFGSALVQPSNDPGTAHSAAAQAVLLQMRHDELTRSAVFGSRCRSFQVDSLTFHRNSAPILVQCPGCPTRYSSERADRIQVSDAFCTTPLLFRLVPVDRVMPACDAVGGLLAKRKTSILETPHAFHCFLP